MMNTSQYSKYKYKLPVIISFQARKISRNKRARNRETSDHVKTQRNSFVDFRVAESADYGLGVAVAGPEDTHF
jgi:hypothetical protein